MAVSESVLFFSCAPPHLIEFLIILTFPRWCWYQMTGDVTPLLNQESTTCYMWLSAINRTEMHSFQFFVPFNHLSSFLFFKINYCSQIIHAIAPLPNDVSEGHFLEENRLKKKQEWVCAVALAKCWMEQGRWSWPFFLFWHQSCPLHQHYFLH